MEVVVYILLLLLLMLSILLAGPPALYWSYIRVRRKGLRPPAAALILLASLGAAIWGAIALRTGNSRNLLGLVWYAVAVPTLMAVVLLAAVKVLPHRAARVFGERRTHFPFRGVGRLLEVLAILVALLGLVTWWMSEKENPSGLWQVYSVAFLLWAAGRFLVREAKTLHAPPPEGVLQKDSRAPVLYLRAFNQESRFFAIGKKDVYGKWAKSFLAAISWSNQKVGITLEEYLGPGLNASIGPFVALGNPEDYLAPPGALRIYAKDDEWKARFDELARRAACVILEVSKSENLDWEFEHLRAEGLQEKLFVLTRPSTAGSPLAWAYWGMLWRVRGIRSMTWPEFSGDLKKVGYEISFDDPGPGAVLAFDPRGKGFVLTTEGTWPQEFVEPIRAWISERKKVGRCVQAQCLKCGLKVYSFQNETEPLCFDCRTGTTRKSRRWLRVRRVTGLVALILASAGLGVLVAALFPGTWVDRWFRLILAISLLLVLSIFSYLSARKKTQA